MKSDEGEIATIDQYTQAQPEGVREVLAELRETIRRAAPEATEKKSYRMPTLGYFGNLVHLAAFENHVEFYPTPTGIEAFEEEIHRYKHGKGSVHFPLTATFPLDLVSRIVQFRVEENADGNDP